MQEDKNNEDEDFEIVVVFCVKGCRGNGLESVQWERKVFHGSGMCFMGAKSDFVSWGEVNSPLNQCHGLQMQHE